MSVQTKFMLELQETLSRYEGVMVPVKASLLERLFKRTVPLSKLLPNPGDEFCWPSIGPNYSIIAKYEQQFLNADKVTTSSSIEPLTVEKVRPDGYLLLNGHHRWAAAKRIGMKRFPVQIVNLTQEVDIQRMIRASRRDKRVTLDLDEVVFTRDLQELSEKPLPFPLSRFYKERIRLGVPGLLHFLSKEGYDIWVYTADYYSVDYIQSYFRRYSVKVDGVITGTSRKLKEKDALRQKADQLFASRYKETLHIDEKAVLRTIPAQKSFEEFPIERQAKNWSADVIQLIKGINKQ